MKLADFLAWLLPAASWLCYFAERSELQRRALQSNAQINAWLCVFGGGWSRPQAFSHLGQVEMGFGEEVSGQVERGWDCRHLFLWFSMAEYSLIFNGPVFPLPALALQ